jgi:hypothetical protein
VIAPAMSRFLVWQRATVDETDGDFVVRDRAGRALACVGFDGRPEADSLLTRDEAPDIAVNVTRLPEHRSTQLKLKPPVIASA